MNKETDQRATTTPDFNQIELEVLKYWDDNQIFQKSLDATSNGEPYVFYDGPPFASGMPHYGHLLASTIKDAIPRYQTMKGRFVRRRWGWDCHGLPIENIVEQHLKISGKKQIEEVGVERFNKVCRDNVLTYVHDWGSIIHRLGRWVDFDGSYKTMDTSFMESVWWALKQIWDKGLIYEDRKVLMYCSRCETPISNFEVAMDNSYREVTEKSVYAKFKLSPKQRILDQQTDEATFILAWTTTPWTLPANVALAVGSEITYVLAKVGSESFVLAKEKLAILGDDLEILAEFSGRSLEGLSYEPLFDHQATKEDPKAYKIYGADYVNTEDGTGVVHTAPMYGEDDYKLGREQELPKLGVLDVTGKFTTDGPEFIQNMFFKDADKAIIAHLEESGFVFKEENYTHSYPHCHRCGTPLYYSALPSWFIDIQKNKDKLISANEDISWYPAHLKEGRFKKSVEAAPDWNLSRNRYWATPLPFWVCDNKDCDNRLCIGSIAELKEQSSNFAEIYSAYNASGNLDDLDLHRPYIDQIKIPCSKCDSSMSRISDVVDCWFESASMPFAELHYPFENQDLFNERFPADFVSEYIAQTRAWFYVTHVLGVLLFDRAPFKNVLSTGTILAEDGSKMSKSKNNFPDPLQVITKYGSDAVRFYLLASPVMNSDDLSFSEKSVSEVSRKVNMLLWNIHGFWRTYFSGVLPEGTPKATSSLDRWALAELKRLHVEVTQQLDNYNTVKAGKAILDFITDISTWYVRRSRDRIKAGSDEAGETLNVLGYVLAETSKLLCPFMPFLSEHLYRDITGQSSVHLSKWSDLSNVDSAEKLLEEMKQVREVVTLGHALRKNLALPVRQPLASMSFLSNQETSLDEELLAIVLEELNVKKIDAGLADKQTTRELIKDIEGTGSIKKLFLDTELNDELRAEGLARELERQIQDLRKKSGLKVGEVVDLYYNTTDEDLEHAITTLLDRKKTFVNQVSKSFEIEVEYEIQTEVAKSPIWLGLIRP